MADAEAQSLCAQHLVQPPPSQQGAPKECTEAMLTGIAAP